MEQSASAVFLRISAIRMLVFWANFNSDNMSAFLKLIVRRTKQNDIQHS